MEVWDLYDKNGNKTGKTHLRQDPLKPGDYHMVVENWIKNSNGDYLIQKRTRPLREYINPWSTTAGSATIGESTLLAVQRETEEEMGILFDQSEFKFIERTFANDFFMDVYETTFNGRSETIKFDPIEVSAVKWATVSDIQRMYRSKEFYSHRSIYLTTILNSSKESV